MSFSNPFSFPTYNYTFHKKYNVCFPLTIPLLCLIFYSVLWLFLTVLNNYVYILHDNIYSYQMMKSIIINAFCSNISFWQNNHSHVSLFSLFFPRYRLFVFCFSSVMLLCFFSAVCLIRFSSCWWSCYLLFCV